MLSVAQQSQLQSNPTLIPPNNNTFTSLAQTQQNNSQLNNISNLATNLNMQQQHQQLLQSNNMSNLSKQLDSSQQQNQIKSGLNQSSGVNANLLNNNNNNSKNQSLIGQQSQTAPVSSINSMSMIASSVGYSANGQTSIASATTITSVTASSNGNTNNILSSMMEPMGMSNMMTNFDDPVEQSLASLEQPSAKCDIGNVNPLDLIGEMSSIMNDKPVHSQQSLMQQLGFDNMHSNENSNNGFGLDSAALNTLNGLTNSSSVVATATGGIMMNNMPTMSQTNAMSQANQLTMAQSIFDTMARSLPSSMPPSTLSTSSSIATSMALNSNTSANTNNGGNGLTTGGFRPKPIEDLLPSHDKKSTSTPPPPMSHTPSSQPLQPMAQSTPNETKSNPVHSLNKAIDPQLKNIASSWSSLAAAGSPQNTPTSNKPKPVTDSFQAFRNKAKEKADRLKMLEQQETLKRSHKEAEKRQHEVKKEVEPIR